MIKGIVLFVILVVGAFAINQWHVAGRPYYWKEQARVESEVINPDHDANDQQLGRDISAARKGRNPKNFSINDIEKDRLAVLPSAERAHRIELLKLEWEAGAQGRLLSHPARTIRGNDWHWVKTDIPVVSCMKITAAGEIWRNGGNDAPAGPDGADYSRNPLHANKSTVIPGLRWGTFIGKVCDKDDAQGNRCGVEMPLGSLAYRSPNQIIAGGQVGAGVLWVWTNQFGTRTDRSDYNIAGGSFNFDAEAVQQAMCDAVTTVH